LIATGAGFEMRRVLGTAVFGGMVGVTLFGLFLTPVFYVVLRGFSGKPKASLALADGGSITSMSVEKEIESKETIDHADSTEVVATPSNEPAEELTDDDTTKDETTSH